MLTKVELDGFKTFDHFTLRCAPLTVVLGRNAAGKSNFFDGLRLVSRLAQFDVGEAMRDLRGEPWELFRAQRDGRRSIRISLEALIDPHVSDAFGKEYDLKNTLVRYEVEISFPDTGRPTVTRESFVRLPKMQVAIQAHPSRFKFNTHKPYLSTSGESGSPQFVISQDGNQGRNQRRPAVDATATVLSTMRDGTFPHLFAFAEYLRSWQFLHFDPAGLREPSEELSGERLHPTGRNIAAVLGLMMMRTRTDEDPLGLVGDISRDLSALVDGVLGVRPEFDQTRRRWELVFETVSDGDISARVASDGTLRLTALLTALADPKPAGLICFEEPENGVHPERLAPLLDLMAGAVTDLRTTRIEPLRQLVVNSHSPVVLNNARHDDAIGVIFMDRVERVSERGAAAVSRARYVPAGALVGRDETEVSSIEVERYLTSSASPAA